MQQELSPRMACNRNTRREWEGNALVRGSEDVAIRCLARGSVSRKLATTDQ